MFQCKDLLSLPTLAKAQLIAGKSGLNRGIRWSYKPENMNFSNWVHGHELLIVSTALISAPDFDLEQIIQNAIQLNLSGILLLVGEGFIHRISKKNLLLADDNHLPLIALPGNIPLVDIFEELGHAIAYHDQTSSDHEDFLSSIIFGEQTDETYLHEQAKNIGYHTESDQRIFVIHLFPKPVNNASVSLIQTNTVPYNHLSDILSNLKDILYDLFQKNDTQICLSRFSHNLIGMCNTDISKKCFNDLLTQFLDSAKSCAAQYEPCIGIGSAYTELCKLKESFREATTCIHLLQRINTKKIQWYEELGFAKVILSMEDTTILKQYSTNVLSSILEYDQSNNSNLIHTLQAYFYCNENMKDTASALFTHPNTIKYRLSRITEISGYDFSNSAHKLELQNALLIHLLVD